MVMLGLTLTITGRVVFDPQPLMTKKLTVTLLELQTQLKLKLYFQFYADRE